MDEMHLIKPSEFCPKHLGTPLDSGLFIYASAISPDYQGGVWKFESNGTVGYGYPDSEETFHCENNAACYECEASAKVLGMAATLYFLNRCSWACHEVGKEERGQWYAEQYYALRDWMFENFNDDDAVKVHWLLD